MKVLTSCTSINKYLSHCLNNIIMPLFNVLQTLGISETNMLEGHCLFSMFQTMSEKSSSAACKIVLYHHTPLLLQCSPFQALTGKIQ